MSKQQNALNPLQNENDDDDQQQNMGEKTLSLEAILANETDPKARQEAETAARIQMEQSVEEDMRYWARISSTVYAEDIKEGALDKYEGEFKDYAKTWLRLGKGLDVFSDIQELKDKMKDKVERNLEKKERKAKAAARREQIVQLNAADAATRAAHAEAQRQAQAARDALRSKNQAELQAAMFKPLDVSLAPSVDFNAVLTLLDKIEEKYFKNAPEIFEAFPELDKNERELLDSCYEHMMFMYQDVDIKRKYHYDQNDHTKPKHKLGQPVEAYFANVKNGTFYRRKLLSMEGLRNLIIYGPAIYQQLKEKLFAGNPASYGASEGLNLMKNMTGQLVDLDCTVLRCSCPATLNAINMSNKHKKLPTFANSDQFGKSTQAQEIAVSCAAPLLEDFAKKMKLTQSQIDSRKINWKNISTPVHVAGDNSDRGHHAVWQYINAGQNSFHANVPTLDDVSGALLRSPYHCLRHWAFIFAIFGNNPEELKKKVAAFFEDCVADSCFNMKWKAIEEFGEKLAHEGTIVDVIQRTQAENQKIFNLKFFEEDDDDQTKEIAEMTRLCSGKMGREVKTGKIRLITGDDVKAWCKDASVKI